MRAHDLDHAIALQNGVVYGLTAGLHSLDEEEARCWTERVAAGNLYVNRVITGAVVQRQPFGGWKRSSIGPGAKAGGPNYTRLFVHSGDEVPPEFERAERSFREAWEEHFAIAHDPAGLRFERNLFRYRPCGGVVLRLSQPDTLAERVARLAAEICGVRLEISCAASETDESFAGRMSALAAKAEFLRTTEIPSDTILRAAHAAGLNWVCAPLSAVGRLELTRWLREQSVSITRHRYGNALD
jgi:RHH-type proline utilization regulon transcriptional repressor/proline dehydrogenase/delta 1-pyrroline-5-carboxylate dehydrogenase